MRKNARRMQRLLKKHLLNVTAEFFHKVTDSFGDVSGLEKYGEHDLYFSHLLHRYMPYVSLKVKDDNIGKGRQTPMAILVCDKNPHIAESDIVRIKSSDYEVSFCENIKDCYYLLSLVAKK